ncbi:MAG TPA: 50S ribosomal protein L32 [Anaerolineae bacterium]|nr:50S ribosomal protein L32 [Anaerolineae bacterium]
MAVPKRKQSKGRTHRRRSHHALRSVALVECSSCHQMRLPHTACPSCGRYRGRVALHVESAT